MKKILSLGLLVLLCITVFVGCGSSLPDDAQSIATSAVETVDKYFDFEIDYKEATERMRTLESRIGNIDNNIGNENYNEQLEEVRHQIVMLETYFQFRPVKEQEIKEARNVIAEIAGLAKT